VLKKFECNFIVKPIMTKTYRRTGLPSKYYTLTFKGLIYYVGFREYDIAYRDSGRDHLSDEEIYRIAEVYRDFYSCPIFTKLAEAGTCQIFRRASMDRYDSMESSLRSKAWLDGLREKYSSQRVAKRLGELGEPSSASFYFIDRGHVKLFREAFLSREHAAEEEEREPRLITPFMIHFRYEPTLTEDEATRLHRILASFDGASPNMDPCKSDLIPTTDVLWVIDPLTVEGETCVVPIPLTGYFKGFCQSVAHRLKKESLDELEFLQTRGSSSARIEELKHEIAALNRMLTRSARDSALKNDDDN